MMHGRENARASIRDRQEVEGVAIMTVFEQLIL